MTAPVASGWSEFAGWDLHPLEKRRLITAHANSGRSRALNAAEKRTQLNTVL
jgi:hypothetical protein